jgi:hypothetical protein
MATPRFCCGSYEHQDKLPRLPVPELEDTLRRYLTSLEPFISKVHVLRVVSIPNGIWMLMIYARRWQEELETSRAVARDFAKPGGDGQALQQILLQRAKERYNWVRSRTLCTWCEPTALLIENMRRSSPSGGSPRRT